jgi:hypothetical protein
MKRLTLAACLALACGTTHAQSGERAELEVLRDTTHNLIRLLVEQGLLPGDRAEALIREAEKRALAARLKAEAQKKVEDAKVVRVPFIPQTVRDEIRDQLRQEIVAQARQERWGEPGATPDWLDRLRFEGDVRVRLQQDRFSPDNAPATQFPLGYFPGRSGDPFGFTTNTQTDRERVLLRMRLGALARLTEAWSAGLRVVTGTIDNPLSTNVTMGRYFNRSAVVLDRAFIRFDPYPWLAMTAGRFANPFFAPSDLVWHADLSFEGAALTLRPTLRPGLTGFVTGGAFPLQEFEVGARDRWLYGVQGGFEWQHSWRTHLRVGLASYDFRDISGRREAVGSFLAGAPAYGQSAALFRQRGNTVFNIADPTVALVNPLFGLASEYRLTNLSALATFTHFEPITVQLGFDWVRNRAFSEAAVLARTGFLPSQLGPASGNTGFDGRVTVGMAALRERHDWQVFGGYRRLESDATLDAFNDTSFALGGTNTRGYYLGLSYGLDRNVWLTARWLSANEIKGPPLAIDVLQVDLNARF